MSVLTGSENVAEILGQIAKDVSAFAPPPVAIVAALVASGADTLDAVLHALDAGVTSSAIIVAVEAAMKNAAEQTMQAEFK